MLLTPGLAVRSLTLMDLSGLPVINQHLTRAVSEL